MASSSLFAGVVDLRSDTVTRPTASMRRAMAEAEVGDDVYEEDTTVKALEQRAAGMLGKEAALFVPTGTMGNTIAVKLHTQHGQEVIADARAHLLDYELCMTSWFSGCQIRTVDTPNGILTWDAINGKVRKQSNVFSATGLIELENTHNMAGGTIYPLETIKEICSRAHAQHIPVHMDGARIFNAAVASGHPVKEIVQDVDSVMFCLSKGLGAPIGSMLVGSSATLSGARALRKRLGGGMRQAGILAAAGLVALDEMVDRLQEDHANAKYMAEELSHVQGLRVDASQVATNIVFVNTQGVGVPVIDLVAGLKQRGVLINNVGPDHLRIVTHFDAPRAACEKALQTIRDVVGELRRA